MAASDPGSKGGGKPEEVSNHLKTATSIFVVFFLVGLGLLGWLGWTEAGKALNAQYPSPTSTSQYTPTNTPTPVPTPTDTPQPKGSADASAGQAIAKPSLSPTSTPTSTPVLLPRPAAESSAAQHFSILSLLSAIAVLFPGLLLLSFAVQKVPRLAKDLDEDLKKLGLSSGMQKQAAIDEVKQKILSGFLSTNKSRPKRFTKKAEEKAEDLLSWGVEKGWVTTEMPKGYIGDWNGVLNLADHNYQEVNKREARQAKVNARFGWWEFLLPLICLTLFVLACMAWAFWPNGIFGFVGAVAVDSGLNTYISSFLSKMSPALVAVLVSYLFMVYGLVRRYQRSDITPGGYWEVLKRLFVVFLLGLAVSALIKAYPELIKDDPALASVNTFFAILIGIIIGVFPIGTLGILLKGAQAWIQAWLQKIIKDKVEGKDVQWDEDFTQSLRPRHDITLLDDIDQWDALRIEEEGVIGLQGLAEGDITHLVTWLPFPTSQIVDWVDQAILRLAAGAEPDVSYIKTLRAMGLRGATDLLDVVKEEKGKETVVLAALAVQGTYGDDPILPAQLAAFRTRAMVKEAQEKVTKAKDNTNKTDNPTSGDVAPAVAAVRDAKVLADDALAKVKAGGDTLKDALDAANSLQAKFKTAGEKADAAEDALKAATGSTVPEGLKTAAKELSNQLTTEPDAYTQAQALTDALDKIANPLLETKTKAAEFKEKAEAVSKKAEAVNQTGVPQEVTDAATILTSLTTLAQDAQKKIKADTSLEDVVPKIDALVTLLTDESDEKPKKLLGDDKLKKKDQWTAAVSASDTKAKAYADAQKLVTQVKDILSKAEDGEKAVIKARAEAAATAGAAPVLTPQVLETILIGLERNPNLRRIQRYLTEEVGGIPAPSQKYTPNAGWLGGQ